MKQSGDGPASGDVTSCGTTSTVWSGGSQESWPDPNPNPGTNPMAGSTRIYIAAAPLRRWHTSRLGLLVPAVNCKC